MYAISLITGDGIGPEISKSALEVTEAVSKKCNIILDIKSLEAGDAALVKTGSALPADTLSAIRKSDACLKAPVGESAADVIVVLRRVLDLYANVRPARSYPGTPALRSDIDMVIVRENTEDLYTGKEFEIVGGASDHECIDTKMPDVQDHSGASKESPGNVAESPHAQPDEHPKKAAVALRIISEAASIRIARHAFETARRRGNSKMRVTCVHKSNVMRLTDGIFSRACANVAMEYPDVLFDQMYVDACAMNLIRQPQKFDVIVTTNLFGDILSDESSQVVGGLGMAPAANIGDSFALFEPVHGAGFDIAGKNAANPSSFLLSVAMMFDWLGERHSDESCRRASRMIEESVLKLAKAGTATVDVGGTCTTSEFTRHVVQEISNAP